MWRGPTTYFSIKQPVIAKGGLGLRTRQREALARLLLVPGNAHPLAPAPGGRLDHHRIADLACNLCRFVRILDDAHMPRDGRDLGPERKLLGLNLVPHRLNRLGRRPDEGNPGRAQRFAEGGILGQEAIARMNSLRPGLLTGLNDTVRKQIRLRCWCGSDPHRFIGHLHMHGIPVGVRIDGDRRDSHLPRRLDDATGDFPSVRDKYFLKHDKS